MALIVPWSLLCFTCSTNITILTSFRGFIKLFESDGKHHFSGNAEQDLKRLKATVNSTCVKSHVSEVTLETSQVPSREASQNFKSENVSKSSSYSAAGVEKEIKHI